MKRCSGLSVRILANRISRRFILFSASHSRSRSSILSKAGQFFHSEKFVLFIYFFQSCFSVTTVPEVPRGPQKMKYTCTFPHPLSARLLCVIRRAFHFREMHALGGKTDGKTTILDALYCRADIFQVFQTMHNINIKFSMHFRFESIIQNLTIPYIINSKTV